MILFILLFINLKVSCQSLCECQQLTLKNECFYAGCQWIQNAQTNQFECIDKLPYNQPICSDYKDHLVCDFIQGCAWSNQGKCELFTKCSDYGVNQSDPSDQCYLKDHTCIEGVINEKFISCTSIQEFCMNEELEPINFFSFDSKQIFHFSQIQTRKLQIQLQCIQEKKQKLLCSNIKSEYICTFLRNDEYLSICKWENNQCQDTVQATQLSEKNCFLYTGGTHSWNNNQCMTCSGIFENAIIMPSRNRNLFEISKQPTLTINQATQSAQDIREKIIGNDFLQTINTTTIIQITLIKNCYSNECQLTITSQWTWDVNGRTQTTETDDGQGRMLCNFEASIKSIQDGNQKIKKNETQQCTTTWVHDYSSRATKTLSRASNLIEQQKCTSTEIINSLTDGNYVNKCDITGKESITYVFNDRTQSDITKILGNSTLTTFTYPDNDNKSIPVIKSSTLLYRSLITNDDLSTELIENTVFEEEKKLRGENVEDTLIYETTMSQTKNNRHWKCQEESKSEGSQKNSSTAEYSQQLQNGQTQLNTTTQEFWLYFLQFQGGCAIAEENAIKSSTYTKKETQNTQIVTSQLKVMDLPSQFTFLLTVSIFLNILIS